MSKRHTRGAYNDAMDAAVWLLGRGFRGNDDTGGVQFYTGNRSNPSHTPSGVGPSRPSRGATGRFGANPYGPGGPSRPVSGTPAYAAFTTLLKQRKLKRFRHQRHKRKRMFLGPRRGRRKRLRRRRRQNRRRVRRQPPAPMIVDTVASVITELLKKRNGWSYYGAHTIGSKKYRK